MFVLGLNMILVFKF